MTLPARLPKHRIPATYTWIAPTHDLLAGLVEARARRTALEWAAVRDGERVLEVAVGTGLSFEPLVRANPTGWTEGIDLTPAMLRRARRRAERIGVRTFNLRLGDAYALPYRDASFDLVMNSYMFDLLPVEDFSPVLAEIKRVLKPGGRFVQINMTHGLSRRHRLWERLYRLHPFLLGGCRGVRLEPTFHRAGFEKVRRAYVVQGLFPSEVLIGVNPTSPLPNLDVATHPA